MVSCSRCYLGISNSSEQGKWWITGLLNEMHLLNRLNHRAQLCYCVKSVHVWSSFGPYSVRIRKNTDQKNSDYGHFSRSACFSRLENYTAHSRFQFKLSHGHLVSCSGLWPLWVRQYGCLVVWLYFMAVRL